MNLIYEIIFHINLKHQTIMSLEIDISCTNQLLIQNQIQNNVVPDNEKLRNIYQKSKRVFIMTAK